MNEAMLILSGVLQVSALKLYVVSMQFIAMTPCSKVPLQQSCIELE